MQRAEYTRLQGTADRLPGMSVIELHAMRWRSRQVKALFDNRWYIGHRKIGPPNQQRDQRRCYQHLPSRKSSSGEEVFEASTTERQIHARYSSALCLSRPPTSRSPWKHLLQSCTRTILWRGHAGCEGTQPDMHHGRSWGRLCWSFHHKSWPLQPGSDGQVFTLSISLQNQGRNWIEASTCTIYPSPEGPKWSTRSSSSERPPKVGGGSEPAQIERLEDPLSGIWVEISKFSQK